MNRMFMIALCGLLCTGMASAQFNWTDGFEPYVPGTLCSNPGCANVGNAGGWAGWDDVPAVAANVVTTATASFPVPPRTGSQFLEIVAASDAVQPLSLNYPGSYPTSGMWEISAWSYIPTGANTATTWFIVNNVYNHGGPHQWSLQLQMTPAGVATDVDRGGSVPLVFDQWVQIRVLVDLDNNAAAIYYNGQQVSSGVWNNNNPGPPAIAAIDLYTGGTIFYDDLSVSPAAPIYETNSPEANLDVNGVMGMGVTPGRVTVPLGTPVVLNVTSTLTGNLYDMGIAVAPIVPALFTTPNFQTINVDLFHPSFFFLNSGTPAPNLIPFPGNYTIPFNAPAFPLTISAQMIILDPTHPDGFQLSQAPELITVPCANPENFDSAIPGTGANGSVGTYPVCWTNGPGTFPWQVKSGSTTSASTGPTGDHTTGSGNYIYAETSQGSVGSTYIINAPPSQPTTGSVSFWYHMWGATTGTLALQELQGGVWTTIWSLAGDQGNQWLQASNVAVTTNPVTLRFHYTRGTSFTGDAAIDDFQIN